MNETINNLIQRRSVREYTERQVPDDVLSCILEAGQYAPSGMGRQPVVMVAVRDKETRDQLSRMNAKIMGSDQDPFYQAPCVVVVLADKTAPTYLYDGSLAMGNLMNAAFSLGVDSCWIHRGKEMFQSEEGKALLKKWGIEGEYEGIGNCILGYRKGELPAPKPRMPHRVVMVD
ncbi:MAG TPA: nitroreductase [Candidatus Hungatella pullicola]|nr:nitroreductase [Candidatus Hungatella pullicola]